MKRIILLIILIGFIIFLGFSVKWSKLFSHGELSRAHEELEESGECSACHTKGQKLDNDKCLLCHDEIKTKIEANSGLHAKATKECAVCHSEHHGQSFYPAGWHQVARVLKCGFGDNSLAKMAPAAASPARWYQDFSVQLSYQA